jgi:uncharacterized damage-inducible protein DinB
MKLDVARELLTHNTWANTRILDAVAVLEPEQFTRRLGGSYPSVQATLTHILWAEWLWLERWQGHSPMEVFAPDEFPSVSAIRARWSQIQASQEAFGGSLTQEQLQQVLRYTNRKGEVWEYALWRMLYHLCNHSTYHRGQVVNLLRLLGAEPKETDFLVFRDEGPSARRRTSGS